MENGRIGIQYDPGAHRILRVYIGSPAEKRGLLPGDIILSHSGNDITGPVGTDVSLLLSREGVGNFLIAVERVPYDQIDKRRYLK